MVRSCFIQQVAAGIFNYMPLGWRSIQKIRRILTEEMDNAEAQEVNMPVVQPRDIWVRSERADVFLPPLASFEDRRGRTMVLAPTHEETATIMARAVISSYRDLPALTYHIQTKFRDEARPRAGLLRVREFEMKDAYSFDANEQGLDDSFELMAKTYLRIFERCGTKVVMAEADSGPIGGKSSREFLLLADSGDDLVLICDKCSYAANLEKAECKKTTPNPEPLLPIESFPTPGIATISALSEAEKMPQAKTAKAVFYSAKTRGLVFAVIRGDYAINETKLRNVMNDEIVLADPEDLSQAGIVAGYASPVGIDRDNLTVVVDDSLEDAPNLLAGANKKDTHLRNVNFPRDFAADIVADIAETREGDACVKCTGILSAKRGIEVGHIFKLGSRYSEKLGLSFMNAEGKEVNPLMGSYGIGLGRLLAAAVEANHDEKGMMLPKAIAPYAVFLLGMNMEDSKIAEVAENLYAQLLEQKVETLFDDRLEPPGVKLNDADLLGMPVRAVVSSRALKKGGVELKPRRSDQSVIVGVEEAAQEIINLLKNQI